MSDVRPTLILHHSGELSGELQDFFKQHGFALVALPDFDIDMPITHILTSGEQDFHGVNRMFNTLENDIQVIALSDVKDLPSFVTNNGKLVVDQKWLGEKMGVVVLEKYFLGQASIQLAENFPEAREGLAIKFTNHLRMGHELDRLCQFVHDQGGSVVNVRTFVDHAVYYLTYLKQAGIAGLPIELDCARTAQETVLQLHLPVKNYVAEYLLDSFGQPNGQDPLRYLLAVCVHSADFTEVQYIQSAGKLVLTGIWQDRKRARTLRFSGLMINHVSTTAQIERRIEQQLRLKAPPTETQLSSKAEQLKDKPLPGHLLEMVMPEAGHDGYLKDHPDLAKQLVAFAVDQWHQQHPDRAIGEMTETQLTDILTEFYQADEVANLVDADLQHVMERVRKVNVSDAYEKQIERVRSGLKEDDAFQKVMGEKLADEVAQKVVGALDEEALAQLVKGGAPAADVPVVVGGGEDGAEPGVVVKGQKTKDDLINRISGGIAEELSNQMIKGEAIRPDDFIMRVGAGLGEQVKGDWQLKTGLAQNLAPDKMRHSLERFAAKMGQTLERLSTSDLQLFAQSELPKILDDMVTVDESFVIPATVLPELPDYKFRMAFQDQMAAKLATAFPGKSSGEIAGIITAEEQEKLMREVVRESVKTAVLADGDKSTAHLVSALSSTLKEDESSIKTIISGAQDAVKKQETQEVIQRLFDTAPTSETPQTGASADAANAILIEKLRAVEAENSTVKGQLSAAMTEIRVLKDSKAQLLRMDQDAREKVRDALAEEAAGDKVVIKADDILPVEEKLQIIQDLAAGKEIDPVDTQKLKEALEREQKIILAARQAEADIRKAKLEMQQKDALFKQEIEKAQRALKSRDLIVQKAKDSMTMIVGKKDKEIQDLHGKISALVTSQASADQQNQAAKIKALEQDKQSLTRLVEVYKNKLTSFAANMEKQGAASNPKKDEEVRKLTLDKQRAEVALQAMQKEAVKLKSKLDLDQGELARLRSEKTRLEEALKSAISSSGPVAQAQAKASPEQDKLVASLQEELKSQTQKASKYELNIKELEAKVAELTGMLAKSTSAGGDPATKAKMAQMEATVKKLSADFAAATNQLGESKKEINKARAESTALKNQLEKLKKDMEKAASKAKPGAPAAASKKAS